MSSAFIRRFLLLSLVAICLLAVMASCSTPDVMCDMKADYQTDIPPYMEGKVLVRWQYGAADLPQGVNGLAECYGGKDDRFCLLRMRGQPASFNNVCALAKEVHEMHHAEGAEHEKTHR